MNVKRGSADIIQQAAVVAEPVNTAHAEMEVQDELGHGALLELGPRLTAGIAHVDHARTGLPPMRTRNRG
jgi:hypothetical protein